MFKVVFLCPSMPKQVQRAATILMIHASNRN
jgi:hypothetical protein